MHNTKNEMLYHELPSPRKLESTQKAQLDNFYCFYWKKKKLWDALLYQFKI